MTKTKETFSLLSIKTPCVTLRFRCDSGLLQCDNFVTVALVLVDLVITMLVELVT